MQIAILFVIATLFINNSGFYDNFKVVLQDISGFINSYWVYMLIIGATSIIIALITKIPIFRLGGPLITIVIINWLILNPLVNWQINLTSQIFNNNISIFILRNKAKFHHLFIPSSYYIYLLILKEGKTKSILVILWISKPKLLLSYSANRDKIIHTGF